MKRRLGVDRDNGQDMLRVAISIQTGSMLPSDILRRLTSSSRKNKLYFALRELGRVVRMIFLLRYVSDLDLRHAIQTATTKSERFNRFVQWVSFGSDSVIAENVRHEQRKFIKYNHPVANLFVFHNLVTMTRAIGKLEADGHQISDQVLAVLSGRTERRLVGIIGVVMLASGLSGLFIWLLAKPNLGKAFRLQLPFSRSAPRD
jgi:TnpA family transposase